MELDAVLVATGRAPYTAGLNLAAVGAAVDRRGFVPCNDSMEGARACAQTSAALSRPACTAPAAAARPATWADP